MLLVSREWRLAVIEVKTYIIDRIAKIQANRWQVHSFDVHQMNPFKQGENQLRRILRRLDRSKTFANASLNELVALPLIAREGWLQRGFAIDYPSCPPLLLADHLNRRGILHCLIDKPS
jgi:hypothetical protein